MALIHEPAAGSHQPQQQEQQDGQQRLAQKIEKPVKHRKTPFLNGKNTDILFIIQDIFEGSVTEKGRQRKRQEAIVLLLTNLHKQGAKMRGQNRAENSIWKK